MSWKANLRPAAFRGVRFHAQERNLESGRRIDVHEFPKRNSPFPEDMGKATRTFSVRAYVIGDDYMSQRNALLKACEREGAGTYTDHWGLTQRVVCQKVTVIETSEEGRYCGFDLEFLEAGDGVMPIAFAATAAQIAPVASALGSAAMSAFASKFQR